MEDFRIDEMVDLILTMIVTNNEQGNNLNFTKADIGNIISKYNIFEKRTAYNDFVWNEIGWIVLWKNKYVTDEQFSKYMGIELVNNEIWIVCDGFSDILNAEYETEIKILDGDEEWWTSGDSYDNNVSEYWDRYTEETLKDIMEYCFKNGIEVGEDEEKMTEENTKLENGDILFNGESLVDLIDDDEFSELKDCLNFAICDAQEDADRNECYNKVKNGFENKIVDFTKKDVKTKNYKGEEKTVEKLYINVNINFDKVEQWLKDDYGNYEFLQENYGSLLHILREMEFFDFRAPDYNYIYGDMDYEFLNEMTRDRLQW